MVVSCHYISCPWLKRQRERERERRNSRPVLVLFLINQAEWMHTHTAEPSLHKNETKHTIALKKILPCPSLPFPSPLPCQPLPSFCPFHLSHVCFSDSNAKVFWQKQTHIHTHLFSNLFVFFPRSVLGFRHGCRRFVWL